MLNIIKNYQTIGIVGLAKNTGKTTTLNYIIENYKSQKIGLTSIGLDGESFDQITYLPKPKIYIYEHMVVATARSLLNDVKFTYRILEETNLQTALGPIVVIEAVTEGYIVLAGPTTNKELNKVINLIKKYVSVVLIDGAFNRMTFASVESMDAIILATGASISSDMNLTITKTKQVVSSFMLPKTNSMLDSKHKMAVKFENQIEYFKDKDLNKLIDSKDMIKAIEFKGALTMKMAEFLVLYKFKHMDIIVEDATKILLNPQAYEYLSYLNNKIFVLKQVPLIAITINPFSPTGNHYDKDLFLKEMNKEFTHPIYNIKEMRSEHVKT